ncbi:ATP-dependent DNA helicase RecQ [Pontimicrobium sp. IMCC45349]|uniref:RecQ family ATP-dependent DNA helicase n=1 Tax=Pontimicrobium sp. IMCC45349 TaxID=3391574 RepID=UPI0039A3B43F
MQHPIQILERYWNYTSFRPLQEDIINAVLEGNDTFALLPTGGGKSICFQIPALAKEGICIVISPLVALMKNQVATLKEKGIKAMALTSEYSYNDISRMLDNCIYGNYKFLYLSPERLQQDIVQDRIRQMHVNLIAVDEAHCISQWGNDFRPAYKNISLLRTLQPTVNVIALTASATSKVAEDIITELDFISPKVFKQSFTRDNLAYMVFNTEDKLYKISQILKKNPQSSIIYVRNRKATIDISNQLNNKGFNSTYYHGGLSNNEKDLHFSQWYNNQTQVMVATNAFGMGIDKADVKTVIHINLPESIESYFQEAGRAGRNGKKAFAVILKNEGDETQVKKQFLNILADTDYLKIVYRKLCNYFQISYGEGQDTTHDFNFNDFCKTYKLNTHITYNALRALDRTSIISLSQQFHNHTKVQVIVNNNSLFQYIDKHKDVATVLKTILRTYGGILDQEVKINTILISDKSGYSEDYVIKVLLQLEKDEVITLNLKKTDAQITFLIPREDDKTINRISKIISQQNQLKQSQVETIINYINNNTICKSTQLLSYFGEKNNTDCGICSVCIENNTTKKSFQETSIKLVLDLLEANELNSRELVTKSNLNASQVTQILSLLLEKEYIEITSTNTYKIKS